MKTVVSNIFPPRIAGGDEVFHVLKKAISLDEQFAFSRFAFEVLDTHPIMECPHCGMTGGKDDVYIEHSETCNLLHLMNQWVSRQRTLGCDTPELIELILSENPETVPAVVGKSKLTQWRFFHYMNARFDIRLKQSDCYIGSVMRNHVFLDKEDLYQGGLSTHYKYEADQSGHVR